VENYTEDGGPLTTKDLGRLCNPTETRRASYGTETNYICKAAHTGLPRHPKIRSGISYEHVDAQTVRTRSRLQENDAYGRRMFEETIVMARRFFCYRVKFDISDEVRALVVFGRA
jgi:hypothetical protein